MINNQIVTWTAFAILAMFINHLVGLIDKYNHHFYCSRRLKSVKQQNDVVEELLLSVDTLATRLFVLTNL